MRTLTQTTVAETLVHEPVVNRPMLFLDDRYIGHTQNLCRRLNQPVKHPLNPILRPEHPWEGRCVIIWGSVLWDPEAGAYKMWYEAYNPLDEHPRHRLCYATSMDGLHWHKPMLGLIEWRGSRQNNIVHVGENTIDSATVALDPFNPPAAERFKMMLYDHQEQALVRYASPDGLKWKRLGPVRELGFCGDRHSVMADTQQGKWLIYHRLPASKRVIALSSSEDFEHWSTQGQVLAADERQDPPETELYGLIGFRCQGMGLGFVEMFHVLERRLETQLVQLDEGGRPSRYMAGTPFLRRGAWGEWDSSWVCPGNCAPLEVGQELRIYYGGRSTLHWADPPYGSGHTGAIGLARLRAHGWVSLETTGEGSLTTIPLRVCGPHLCINADAEGGSVRAELLNEHGQVLSGYEGHRCYPLMSDATYFKLNWDGSSDLSHLAGQAVRVRLLVQQAKVYSLWFYEGP